jgi:enamine deaminase RidA (YjgF/YER057c/UK114 family)
VAAGGTAPLKPPATSESLAIKGKKQKTMEIVRHETGPRFSEVTVVKTGLVDLIYVAGQVCEDTSLDVTGQTREALNFIDQLLARVGANKTHVVSARIYLASVGDYAAMNAAWDDWVAAGHAPARSTVGVKLIRPDYRVEIEVTAAVPGGIAAAVVNQKVAGNDEV